MIPLLLEDNNKLTYFQWHPCEKHHERELILLRFDTFTGNNRNEELNDDYSLDRVPLNKRNMGWLSIITSHLELQRRSSISKWEV
jgi:hypothetical protein